ncbi:MAG: EamA family transporter [Paraprevotella sp.]|nr:EamA family transporter [Paraprevotella sp.]
MWKLFPLVLFQCLLLSGGQVLLKFALQEMRPFGWNREFWHSLLGNWQFASCGVCYGAVSLLWMFILKNFPFSMAYPMISLSYVLGMFAAILFFHETVSVYRWIGCALIICGCLLILK